MVCLLDPAAGATGIRRQLDELINARAAEGVLIVDVGGDIIADGSEPGLSSPLADALILASCADLNVEVSVAVAGPGLGGELDPDYVVDRCAKAGSTRHRLQPEHVEPFLEAIEHHPSEATALLAAAAFGITGVAETRDKGRLIDITSNSATFQTLTFEQSMTLNPLAQALTATTSLDDAESVAIRLYGQCELEYERRKAATAAARSPIPVSGGLASYRDAALARGVSLTTFRRLSERLGVMVYDADRIRSLVGAAAEPRLPIVHVDRIPT